MRICASSDRWRMMQGDLQTYIFSYLKFIRIHVLLINFERKSMCLKHGKKTTMEKEKATIDRRHFMKLAAFAAGSAGVMGGLPSARAQQFAGEPESPIYLALNMSVMSCYY